MADPQVVQNIPAPFIQAAAENYLPQLSEAVGGIKGLDVSKLYGQQFVAGASPLQEQANTLSQGLGGYQPYLQQAGQYQQAAAGATGPNAYQQYMSPYQQQVIDTTLKQYDIQAQKGLQPLQAQAVGAGAFGGARQGIQQAEYQSQSDLNRAQLQAQLQAQGYGQANQLAQQDYQNQLNLGQYSSNLGGISQNLLGQNISSLSALGAQQQAQNQAALTAQQQLAYQQAYQPLQAVQTYGAGIQPLISGYPGSTQTTQQPSPTALQTGLGVASTLAGIYKAFNPSTINVTSDMRLKENINLIGQSPSGINIYTFKYKGDDNGTYKGVMAQEVPYASNLDENGFYKVDYSKLDVRFEKVA
jgi:hypothetical protein